MKNKKIIFIIVFIILIAIAILVYYLIGNNDKNMNYKFEEGKLYITTNGERWIEVPYNFSITAKHLEEINSGRYREGTYQMNKNKIIFYSEVETDEFYQKYGIDKYVILLICSDDRGKTWNVYNLTTQNYLDVVDKIYFKDNKHGEIVLKGLDGNKYTVTTKDGGNLWY